MVLSRELAAMVAAGLLTAEQAETVQAAMDAPQPDNSAAQFVPLGADEPLPPVPDIVQITDDDKRQASAAWDAALPKYAGLLNARPVGKRTDAA